MRLWWLINDALSRRALRRSRRDALAHVHRSEAAIEAVATRGVDRPLRELERDLELELRGRGESWEQEAVRLVAQHIADRAQYSPEYLRRARAAAAAHNARVTQDERRLAKVARHLRRHQPDCAYELIGEDPEEDGQRVLRIERWSPDLAERLQRIAAPTRLVVRSLDAQPQGVHVLRVALQRWVDPVLEAAGFRRSGDNPAPDMTVEVVYEADPEQFLRRYPDDRLALRSRDRWPPPEVGLSLTFRLLDHRVDVELADLDITARLRELGFSWLAGSMTELSDDLDDDVRAIGVALALVLDVNGPAVP